MVLLNLISILSDYVNKKVALDTIDKFESDEKRKLGSFLVLQNSKNDFLINRVSNEDEFKRIYSLFKASQKDGILKSELLQIFENNKDIVRQRIEDIKDDLYKDILGEKYDYYHQILSSEIPKREKVAKNLLQSRIKKNKAYQSQIRNIEIAELSITYPAIDMKLLLDFNVKDHDLLKEMAYVVYNPEILVHSLWQFEKEWDSFPFKWFAKELPISTVYTLFMLFKKGEDFSKYFIKLYEGDGIYQLNEYLENDIIPNYKDRKTILEEIIINYKEGRFASVIYSILPQIEGILWDYSELINPNEIYKDKLHSVLLSKNGKEITDPTIGVLLRNTIFSERFHNEFIEYFCDELYYERNPILHGRDLSKMDKNGASKKIATFHFLMIRINRHLEEHLFEKLDEILLPKIMELSKMKKKLSPEDIRDIIYSIDLKAELKKLRKL